MKIRFMAMLLGAAAFSTAPLLAQYPGQNADKMKVQTVVPFKALSFDYSDVHLLNGPFKTAMEIDQKWLKTADVDRFMHNYRVTAGLPSHAQAFGGWESLDTELRGHSLGHMLTALAEMYATTGDKQYKDKGTEFVKDLAECQTALGTSGYLSAFPEKLVDRAIAGQPVWAPWYTLHKIFAGLIDQYNICGNQQALDVAVKMGNWAYNKLNPLTHEQLQLMLREEFGGMEEAMYNLYAATGDKRFKELAEKFWHDEVFNPLEKNEDKLNGHHANTQIPKIIGEARGYELTGQKPEHNISEYFWKEVLSNHTYVTGGNSQDEYFGEPGKLANRLGENTTETCNTYNMLKLTRHLFIWDASAGEADYYERALYNHILSSQDPISGGVTYFHTLHPGSEKEYNMPFEDHTCCVGTGYENHAKYGEAIYYKTADQNGLYVNLFIASELNWKEKGLTLRQETSFPDVSATKLVFKLEKSVKMPVYLRYPYWATKGITVKVNGKKVAVKGKPSSYVLVDRTWKNGDVIEMQMPMSLHAEYMPDNANRGAILYGPIVLAAELGKENVDATFGVPVFVNADKNNLEKWIKPVEGKSMTFKTVGVGRPAEALLSPLFRINHQHYSVYFDYFTEQDWKNKNEEYQARIKEEKAIEARTVDRIGVGENQSERDHKVESQLSYIYPQENLLGRDVRQNGFIRYQVAVDPNASNELMLTFWGDGSRSFKFDVKIDGQLMDNVEVQADAKAEGKFFHKMFSIPESLTKGKQSVQIEITPSAGHRSGVIYGLSILKKQ
jgi:DUF1680 family protein